MGVRALGNRDRCVQQGRSYPNEWSIFSYGWSHLLVEVNAMGLSFLNMACRRQSGWQSYSIAVLVFLLVTATGVALLHSHKDSAPDCQLCHVRDLPTVHTHAAATFTVFVIAELQWQSDDDTYQLPSFSITRPTRA